MKAEELKRYDAYPVLVSFIKILVDYAETNRVPSEDYIRVVNMTLKTLGERP